MNYEVPCPPSVKAKIAELLPDLVSRDNFYAALESEFCSGPPKAEWRRISAPVRCCCCNVRFQNSIGETVSAMIWMNDTRIPGKRSIIDVVIR